MIRVLLMVVVSSLLLSGCITTSHVPSDRERWRDHKKQGREWLAEQAFVSQIEKDFDIVFTNETCWVPGSPECKALNFYLAYRRDKQVPTRVQTLRIIAKLKEKGGLVPELPAIWYTPHVTENQRLMFALRAELGYDPTNKPTLEAILWDVAFSKEKYDELERLVKPNGLVKEVVTEYRKRWSEYENSKRILDIVASTGGRFILKRSLEIWNDGNIFCDDT